MYKRYQGLVWLSTKLFVYLAAAPPADLPP
jgi:hypothetical protein